jgi:hypothetical protein
MFSVYSMQRGYKWAKSTHRQSISQSRVAVAKRREEFRNLEEGGSLSLEAVTRRL